MTEACGTCHFQRASRCHRYPPIPMLSAGTVRPPVTSDQWCGEYRAAAHMAAPLRIPVEFDEPTPPPAAKPPAKKR